MTVSNKALTWGTVNGAVGYIVLKGDKLIAITTKTTYTDETDGEGKYSVKTIDEMGRLVQPVWRELFHLWRIWLFLNGMLK